MQPSKFITPPRPQPSIFLQLQLEVNKSKFFKWSTQTKISYLQEILSGSQTIFSMNNIQAVNFSLGVTPSYDVRITPSPSVYSE